MTTARYPDINDRHAAGHVFHPHRGRPMNDDAPPRLDGWKHLPSGLHPDYVEATEPEPPPDFPVNAYPPFARSFVEEYARFGGVALGGPATFGLGAMSCGLAGKFEVCLKLGEPGARGYYQPLNLFTLVVADTGERKSDALDAAFRPVYDHQAELTDLWKAEGPAAEAEAEAAKASAADAANRLKKSPNDRDLRKAYADALAKQEGSKAPPAPRLTTKDVTPEQLAGLMSEQGGRMCVAVDEAGFLRNALGKYSANGDTSLDVYLQGYSRQPVQIDRKSGPPIYMRRPTLTIAAGFQPGALRQAGNRSDFRDLGMLARFLLSVPGSLSGRRSHRTPAMRSATIDAWARTLRAMLTYPTPPAGAEPPYVALSRDADAQLEALFDEIELGLDPTRPGGGGLVHMKDWVAKFISAVGRIAGVLHFSTAGARGELDLAYERPVSGETMRSAIAVGRYYLAHARYVYEVMLAPPEAARAKSLQAAALRTLAWLFPDGQSFVTSAPILALWPGPKAVPPPDAAFARERLAALTDGRADNRPTLQALGIALGHLVGKPHEGLVLERRGKAHGNVACWAVVRSVPPVPPVPPSGGGLGGPSS